MISQVEYGFCETRQDNSKSVALISLESDITCPAEGLIGRCRSPACTAGRVMNEPRVSRTEHARKVIKCAMHRL